MKKQIRSLVAITLALMFVVVGMVPSFAATELPSVCPGATATHTPDNCTYSTEVVPATCQEFGYTLCTCDVCGAKFVTDVTEKDTTDGHVWLTVQEYKSVPCSGTALPTVQKCAYCAAERFLDADGEAIDEGDVDRAPTTATEIGFVWSVEQTPTHTWTVPVTSCEVKVTTCADCGATKATTGEHNYKVTYGEGTATVACTKCGAAPEELGDFEIVVPCEHEYTYVPMTRTCGYGFTLAHYECSLCDCWFFPAEYEWYDDELYVYITDTDTFPSFVAVDPALFTLTMTDYHAYDYEDLDWTECCTGATAVCPVCSEKIVIEYAVPRHEFNAVPSCCGYLFICSECGLEVEETVDADTLEKWTNEIASYDFDQLFGLCVWAEIIGMQLRSGDPYVWYALSTSMAPATLNFDPDIANYLGYFLATNWNDSEEFGFFDFGGINIDFDNFDTTVGHVDERVMVKFLENTLGEGTLEAYRQMLVEEIVYMVVDVPMSGHSMVATETHYQVTIPAASLTDFGGDLNVGAISGGNTFVTGTLIVTDSSYASLGYPLDPGCFRACETWYKCENCSKTSYAKLDGTEGHTTATAVFAYGNAGTLTVEYCTNPWCTATASPIVSFMGGVNIAALTFPQNAPVLKYKTTTNAPVTEYNLFSETFTDLLDEVFGEDAWDMAYNIDILSEYYVGQPALYLFYTSDAADPDNSDLKPVVSKGFDLDDSYRIVNATLEFPGLTTETIVGKDALKAELNKGIFGGEWFNKECDVHSFIYTPDGEMRCEYCTFDVACYEPEIFDDTYFTDVTIYEYKISPIDRIVVTHGEILSGGVTSSMVETTFVYYDGSRETVSGNVATSSKVIMSIVPIDDPSAVEVAGTTVMSHVWNCSTSDTPERLVVWNGSELISVTGITGIPAKSEYTREEYVKYHGDVVSTYVISEQGGYSIEAWYCADCGNAVRVKTPLYNGHVLPISVFAFTNDGVGTVSKETIVLDAADFEAQAKTYFDIVDNDFDLYLPELFYDFNDYIDSCCASTYMNWGYALYTCPGCAKVYGYDRELNLYTKDEIENKTEALDGVGHYWLFDDEDVIFEEWYDGTYMLFVKHAVCSNCGLEVNYGCIDVYYTKDNVIFRDFVTGSDLGLNVWEFDREEVIGRYDFTYDDECYIKRNNLDYINYWGWVVANDHPFWYLDTASQTTYTVPATCVDEGIELYFCDCCDTWYGWKIEKAPHTVSNTESKAPECCEAGYTPEYFCEECGEILTASEVIPATGHTTIYGQTFTSYPCTEQGKVDIYCVNCGYVPEVITHNFVVVTDSASCYQIGYVYKVCADCDFTPVVIKTLTALEHEYVATGTVTVDGVEYELTTANDIGEGWHYVVEQTTSIGGFWVKLCGNCGKVWTDSSFNSAKFAVTLTNLIGPDTVIADSDTVKATISLDTTAGIWGMQFKVVFSNNIEVETYEFVNEFLSCDFVKLTGNTAIITINNWNTLDNVDVEGMTDVLEVVFTANKGTVGGTAAASIKVTEPKFFDKDGDTVDVAVSNYDIADDSANKVEFRIETLGEIDGREGSTYMGRPSLADVNALLHILAGDYEVDGELVTYMATADIDKDGELTEADAAALLRYVTMAIDYSELKATV